MQHPFLPGEHARRMPAWTALPMLCSIPELLQPQQQGAEACPTASQHRGFDHKRVRFAIGPPRRPGDASVAAPGRHAARHPAPRPPTVLGFKGAVERLPLRSACALFNRQSEGALTLTSVSRDGHGRCVAGTARQERAGHQWLQEKGLSPASATVPNLGTATAWATYNV